MVSYLDTGAETLLGQLWENLEFISQRGYWRSPAWLYASLLLRVCEYKTLVT